MLLPCLICIQKFRNFYERMNEPNVLNTNGDNTDNRARYMYGNQMVPYELTQVEYVVNPEIVRNFYNCKKELAKKHNFLYESMNCYLLFHGTSEANMENILKTNFLLSKVGSSTDMGFYGKGFYFSESPLMSM